MFMFCLLCSYYNPYSCNCQLNCISFILFHKYYYDCVDTLVTKTKIQSNICVMVNVMTGHACNKVQLWIVNWIQSNRASFVRVQFAVFTLQLHNTHIYTMFYTYTMYLLCYDYGRVSGDIKNPKKKKSNWWYHTDGVPFLVHVFDLLHCIAFNYVTLRYVTLLYFTLRCIRIIHCWCWCNADCTHSIL